MILTVGTSRVADDRYRFPVDLQLCYRQMGWIETYMNSPEVKKREPRV